MRAVPPSVELLFGTRYRSAVRLGLQSHACSIEAARSLISSFTLEIAVHFPKVPHRCFLALVRNVGSCMCVSHVSSVLVFQPRPSSYPSTLKIAHPGAVQFVHVGENRASFTDEAFAIGYSHLHSPVWIPSDWSPALKIAVQNMGAQTTRVVIHL